MQRSLYPGSSLSDSLINKLDIQDHWNDCRDSDLHNVIDELNSSCYMNGNLPANQVNSLLKRVCGVNNSLLVAKCCQLVLLLESKKKLEITDDTLDCLISTWTKLLTSPDDLCFIDVLQALKVLISKNGERLAKGEAGERLAKILSSDIERTCKLSDPADLRRWRLSCLASLCQHLSSSVLSTLAIPLLDLAYSHSLISSDAVVNARVYTSLVSSLEGIVTGGGWTNDVWPGAESSLGRLLGIVAGGLRGCPPTPLYPSAAAPSIQPAQSQQRNSTGNVIKTKKWKSKKSNSKKLLSTSTAGGGVANESPLKENSPLSNRLLLIPPAIPTSASDSDFSDSETSRLAKEQNRLTCSCSILLIHIVKNCDNKALAGYYIPLLGILNSYLTNIERDCGTKSGSKSRCRFGGGHLKSYVASLTALDVSLAAAKPYLAMAQHHEGSTSFTAYSEILAGSLISLHETLSRCLCTSAAVNSSNSTVTPQVNEALAAPLLMTSATLIKVTPYPRLSSGLLDKIISSSLEHSRNRHKEVEKALCEVVTALLSIANPTEEVLSIISRYPSPETEEDRVAVPWIVSFISGKLNSLPKEVANQLSKDSNSTSSITPWWQAVHAAWINHYSLTGLDLLESIRPVLIVHISLSSSLALRQAAFTALTALLAQTAAADDGSKSSLAVWEWLAPQLVNLLSRIGNGCTGDGKTDSAISDCDEQWILISVCQAMRHISSRAYYSLSDKVQLVLVTQLIGSCRQQEDSALRNAGISAIGVLLSFPDMVSERYICDLSLCVLNAAKDESPTVRCSAVWSLGNLVVALSPSNAIERDEMLLELPLWKMLQVSLDLTKDTAHTRMCCCRTIGALLNLISPVDMADSRYPPLISSSIDFLVNAASQGTFMKIRWNACYALANVLSNTALYTDSPPPPWLNIVMDCLCRLVVSCRHFKVRAGACEALVSVPSRNLYTLYSGSDHYLGAWSALLDGLDTAADTPDFTEYKHQRHLMNQLCSGVCRLTCLLETEEDISNVASLMEYREERMATALRRYMTSDEAPDKCGPGIAAVSHLLSLSSNHPLVNLLISALGPPSSADF